MTNTWWVLHDEELRNALDVVADGTITPDEAIAVLNEHSATHPGTPHLRVTTREDDAHPAKQDDA